MLFRILVPTPGLSLDGSDKLKEPRDTGAAIALAFLAFRIDQEVYRTTLAEAVLDTNDLFLVEDALKQPSNVSRISNVVGWVRNSLPDGKSRVTTGGHGDALYYKLHGERKEVDAYVLIEDKGEAEQALNRGDFSTAHAAATHGLSLWSAPLRHRFFTTTQLGKRMRAKLTECMEDLFDAFTDAALGLSTGSAHRDVREDIRYLEKMSTEKPEFHAHITYSLIRLHKAVGDGREVERLLAGLRQEDLPEVWEKRLANVTGDAEPDEDSVALEADSLSAVSPPWLQAAIAQLDPENRSQAALMDMLSSTPVHPNFRLFIVSGVSAAGKDSLIASAASDATLAQHFDMLTKFTTRKARTNEAGYSQSVEWARILKLVEDGEIAFLYEKRREYYGFSLTQLKAAMIAGTKLVAIFTEFDQVPEARRILRSFGVKVVPILIDVDTTSATRRTRLRQFSKEEQDERIESIREDLDRMRGRALDDEYVVVHHSNDYGFNSALARIRGLLDGTDQQASKFLKEIGP